MIAEVRASGATTSLSASTENQVVLSIPPYTDRKFRRNEPTIMVCPLGLPGDHDYLVLALSIEEAEELSNRLAIVVAQAREGEFSGIGDSVIAPLRLDIEEIGEG